MNNTEIREAISRLQEMEYYLDEEYMNNGGEVTDETERQEEAIAALRELLTTDGVDSLGRWLKSREDYDKTLKAEADAISRKRKNNDSLMDYIKTQINHLLAETGVERAEGTLYSFTATTSVKTSVDKEALNERFMEAIEKKLRGGKNPVITPDVTITLGASVRAVPEGTEIPSYFTRTETPSVRFNKPRARKEKE